MACEKCKYFDENETSGSKGYCEWYKMYVYPDDSSCSHFVSSGSSGTGCFLTTACCSYKGLADDCEELTALRKFRDGYLRKQKGGEAMVDEYYAVAPKIVEKIDACDQRDAVYAEIYETVTRCVALYKNEEYERVTQLYVQMVSKLKDKYLNGDG